MLVIKNLQVSIEEKEILKGVNLELKPGELCVLMGPNGSGKSTLALAVMGNPKLTLDVSRLSLDGQNIAKLSPDKRARLGLFLAFQNPVEVPGVSYFNFLRLATSNVVDTAKKEKNNGILEFKKNVVKTAQSLGFEENLLSRSLNDGFSGGERRKSEILQALTLKPKYAILDEPDSGVDVDAQKILAAKISQLVKSGTGILLITHNPKILKYLKPDFVYIMIDGRIVKSGKTELIKLVEEKGFQVFQELTANRLRSTAVVSRQ